MANPNSKHGLVPVRHYLGAEIQARPYKIASGLASAIGFGSPVKSTGTTKRVTIASAGDTLIGVFAGVQYVDTNGDIKFSKNWVASTATLNSAEATAYVYDDPWILFECQASLGFANADIGGNADLTAESVSSTGMSTVGVDSATYASTTAQVRIVDYVRDDQNEVGDYAKLLVLINEHELKSTAGV